MSSMNSVGRPTAPVQTNDYVHPTLTGARGLLQDEALIFERDGWDKTGVDLPQATRPADDLDGLLRTAPIGLPGLSEPEAMRHYVRLSQKNHAIDLALYPLGSCTMKHNPRLNEKAARMPGFADIHPLQPQSTVQGALELIDRLAHWLKTLTGMPAVAMTPKAGAHGELCGLLAIKAAHEANGQGHRKTVLCPTSAHGTNPATAAFVGYSVVEIAQTRRRPGGSGGSGSQAERPGGGHHGDQPQHLRPVRAGRDRDRPPDPCGRRLLLLRRGQLQRHRRPGAPGRPRRRRHAHQPAQDLLHAPRRRRSGRGSGGAERGAGALRPVPPGSCTTGPTIASSRTRPARPPRPSAA
jgi:hypothetical protein